MSVEDGGIRDAAIRVGASALALLRTRIELLAVEFAQERERIILSVVLIAVASAAFALTAMVVTLGIIAWFWDEHRFLAIVIVAIVYAAAGIAALVAHRRIRRDTPTPFGASTEALRRDVEWLRARHRHESGDTQAAGVHAAGAQTASAHDDGKPA
ncbi:MAG TPA: phage holin family protein [Casimicrobiaceae bacterium]